MSLTEDKVLEALRTVRYPGFTRDIVSFGLVRQIRIDGRRVDVRLDLGPGNPSVGGPLAEAARAAVEAIDDVDQATVRVATAQSSLGLRMAGSRPASVAETGGLDAALLPEVRHVIAVASGKGGVGKSTVAVNLAAALAADGGRVGLLDADIYGPSIPLMMGVRQQPGLTGGGRRLIPFERHGVRFMSLGFLVPGETAVIWRGPMVMKAVEQLLRDVEWGALDVLVVDMPPGTGDAQLTLSQKVRLSGAVIVTTPQDVALADAIKGVNMFRKVGVPVLGLVENMSFFICPGCGERSEIFGHGGGRREADRLGVPLLGEIPLDPAIRDGGDRGEPLLVAAPSSPQSDAFREIAAAVRAALEADRSTPGTAEEPGSVFARFRKKFERS